MSSRNQSSSEATPLLDSSRPACQSSWSIPRERSTFSSETLLIPVAFATALAATIPLTTFIDIQRQAVCELWKITHGHPATLPVGDPITPEICDRPEVARYFASAIAIVSITEGFISIALFGILSRILSRCKRRPAFLFILATRMAGSCLIPGSQYVPRWLAGWVFVTGMLFQLFSGLLPYRYLLHVYVVDVCVPEDRTAALSKASAWGALGTCIGFALGGFITMRTGNPLIVFHIAAAIFLSMLVYIFFVLPESRPDEEVNRPGSRLQGEPSTEGLPKIPPLGSFLRIFAPLKMLIPTRDWRLTWCGVHMFLFMSAHAYASIAWLVLATSRYHLTPADTGLFLTSTSISSAIALMFILPLLVHILRPYYTRQVTLPLVPEEIRNTQEAGLQTSDRLEAHLAFLSCVGAGIFFLGAAAFKSNGALIFFGVCLGLTSIHGPAIRSIVAGSVDPPKQGEALAAIEMVTNAGVILSSIIMGCILTHTIDTRPLLFFYVHLVIVSVSGALLFLVRDVDRCRKSPEA